MSRKRKDLRKLDRDTQAYWNEVLERGGMGVDKGKRPKNLSYVGGCDEVQGVDEQIYRHHLGFTDLSGCGPESESDQLSPVDQRTEDWLNGYYS